jgi:hypothetical protein
MAALSSCDQCNNCGPVLDDPYFTIEFFAKENRQAVTVKLDSINQIPIKELGTHLQNRASSFKLPLSPSTDISQFDLYFTEFSTAIPDTVQYEKQLRVSYRRYTDEWNGTIRIKADQFKVIYHSFDSISPRTFDQTRFSNELRLAVYL